jgi:hypothetical protein
MSSVTKLVGLELQSMTTSALFTLADRSYFVSRHGRPTGTAVRPQAISSIDPEEQLLARLREIDQAQKRAAAHARIVAKRGAVDLEAVFSRLRTPELRIDVPADVLRVILESLPEDDD